MLSAKAIMKRAITDALLCKEEYAKKTIEAFHRNDGGIPDLVIAYGEYADQYHEKFESKLGEDSVLERHFRNVGLALLGMLDGPIGELDRIWMEHIITNISLSHDIDLLEK